MEFMCFFVFCTKFCIAKIVKGDSFGIIIMLKQNAFHNRDPLNSNLAFPFFSALLLK